MPSLWSVFIPAAAALTFAATWLVTPGPQRGVAAPPSASEAVLLSPAPALAVTPSARRSAAVVPRPRRMAAVSLHAVHAVRAAAPVYYPGCNAVRAAGKAPLYRGQPGYREEMDGDQDGIACEAHRRAW